MKMKTCMHILDATENNECIWHTIKKSLCHNILSEIENVLLKKKYNFSMVLFEIEMENSRRLCCVYSTLPHTSVPPLPLVSSYMYVTFRNVLPYIQNQKPDIHKNIRWYWSINYIIPFQPFRIVKYHMVICSYNDRIILIF